MGKKLLREGEILIIVHFRGGFGLLSTRGRPAKNTRESGSGEILKSVLFWQRRGVYQCTSVPVVSINSPARTYMVLENDWYTGTVVSEEWESDNRASVFWGMSPAVQNPCVS